MAYQDFRGLVETQLRVFEDNVASGMPQEHALIVFKENIEAYHRESVRERHEEMVRIASVFHHFDS